MNIQGKRPLATLTNQVSGSAAVWTVAWKNTSNVAITLGAKPTPLSGSIRHGATLKPIKDYKGNTVAVLSTDDQVTMEMVAVPLGDAGPGTGGPPTTTLQQALDAAYLPVPGTFVTVGSAPTVNIGGFSDVFNSGDWIYNGDGEISLSSDGEWGLRFSLTRYANVTAAASVVL